MNKSDICSTQFCCKFPQLHFCQILFKLVFISHCYHESHGGEVFLKHSVGYHCATYWRWNRIRERQRNWIGHDLEETHYWEQFWKKKLKEEEQEKNRRWSCWMGSWQKDNLHQTQLEWIEINSTRSNEMALSQHIWDFLIMRYINLHFTYLLTYFTQPEPANSDRELKKERY